VGARKRDQGPADFGPRGVTVGVQNACQRVSPLACAQQLPGLAVEGRAPLHQLRHPQRTLGYKSLGCKAVNNSIASVYRILKVQRDVLLASHGDGDSALRIMRV